MGPETSLVQYLVKIVYKLIKAKFGMVQLTTGWLFHAKCLLSRCNGIGIILAIWRINLQVTSFEIYQNAHNVWQYLQ